MATGSSDVVLTIGVDAGPAADDVAKFGRSVAPSLAPATGAVGGLEKAFKDFRREQVQEGRLVGFYAREIGGFVGASDGASSAVGGLTQGILGLASATSPVLALWAAFEVGGAVVGWFSGQMKEAEENAKKAAESLGRIGDQLEEIRRKRAGTTDIDVDAGKLAAAQRLVAARDRSQMALSAGGVGLDVQDDAARQLNALNAEIAAWEKVNGKLESYVSLQGKLVAARREAAQAARDLAIADSAARGNLEYEMAGGDGGALAIAQKMDQARAGYQAMGAAADVSLAKARGASESELEALRLKASLIPLNAQLSAASSQAEIDATKKRIAALKEESRLRQLALAHQWDEMLGPGNALGEFQFGQDTKMADAIRAQNEREAASYDAGNFDLSGISASQVELARLNEEGKRVPEIMSAIGDSIGSAFGSIGDIVGGAAGQFLEMVGRMIQQAVQLAISLAAASVAWTSPLGMVAIGATALAGLLGLIASVPSFDVGTLSVPKTGLAMVHRGEAILPAGGPAESYRAGVARSGGRSNVTVNLSLNVTALDGPSVYQTLTGSRDQLARVIREAVRDGVIDT